MVHQSATLGPEFKFGTIQNFLDIINTIHYKGYKFIECLDVVVG